MRKANSLLVAGLATLCLGSWALDARACDEKSGSAEKVSSGHCSASASAQLTSGSGCTIKGSMAHLFKQAPGTKASFKRIENGVVMTVSAASAEYVPVVQKAVMTEMESMTMMAGTCAVSAAKAGESCSFAKTASVEKAGSSCSAAKSEHASVEKASTSKAGASCCASKGAAAKASMEQASASSMECPDWMKVLCGANCKIENTSTGITITWTTEKTKVAPLHAAAEQLEAEVSRL